MKRAKPTTKKRLVLPSPRDRREADMGLDTRVRAKPVAQQDDPPDPSGLLADMPAREKKIHAQALKRFNAGEAGSKAQRQREKEDLGFYASDINYQWDPQVVKVRGGENGEGTDGGSSIVPARPCLVIPTVKEPVLQVMNQERQADLGIEITPANDFGDEFETPIDAAEIELREGLVRRIQRESNAKAARTWAFSRAVQCGTGYYAVRTRYVNTRNDDQEVYVELIYNQTAVLLDPGHTQPDGSDADWEFVGSWVPWDSYAAQFPDSRLSTVNDDTIFEGLKDTSPSWFTLDGESRGVRVVDYFWTAHESRTLASGRIVDDKTIYHTKLNGIEILAETEWPCDYMPIVKVTGNELHPYDRERRIEGMVRPARDSGRAVNFMASKLMEVMATATLAPYMMAEGQADGYEDMWQAAATRVQPFVYYKQKDVEGNPAGEPVRLANDAPVVNIANALNLFREAVRTATGVPSSTLGEIDPSIKSGKAIKALLEQSQRGTSNYLDNYTRSVGYEAKIENALMRPIYNNRPGRLVQIMTGANQTETRILGQPFTLKNGKAQRLAPNTPPNGVQPQTVTLSDAEFNVNFKVSKNYDTRREQEAAELGDIIQADPNLMQVFGDLYFKAQDGPGSKELSDRMKLVLSPQVQAALKLGANLPPEVASQVAVMQGQLQQATQALQNAHNIIQTKQVESQADIQKAQLDNDTKVKIAEIQSATQIAIAQAKVDAENFRSLADASDNNLGRLENLKLKLLTDHMDQQAQHRDQAHEVGLAALSQAHGLTASAQSADQASQQADQSHQQALEQQVQSAALNPPQEDAAP